MKILVTGGSGSIGGYVLRDLLQAGHAASCYSRTPPAIEGVRFLCGDIMKLNQLKGACSGHDAVIHLAAVPGPGRATPADMVSVNVVGTVNVLEAALAAGIDKVVFASSGAATGFAFQVRRLVPRYVPLDEDHPCEPQDEYGLSKLLAELICKRYTDALGLRTICLRINNNWYLKREEAAVVVRSAGWAQKLGSVEGLWEERYKKTIEDPHGQGDWPVPGPPMPPNILWAFTDARDAAQAFRVAAEDEEIVHDVFLINGDDTCANVESKKLIDRHYPEVQVKEHLEGYRSLWSHRKATRLLGYRPLYTWRDSNFSRWLEGKSE